MKQLPPLRDWQEIAFQRWVDNSYKGTFEVATGGGKTTFALLCFDEIRRIQPNVKCLVVVPTTALLDQWYLAFQEDLGIQDVDIKILNTRDMSADALINLVIVNTARRFNGEIKSPENFLLIVDECHRTGSAENSKALVRNTLGTIGLSATPNRDFDSGFEDLVSPVLGKILMKYSLEDAIKDGVLADLSLTYIKIPLLASEQEEYDSLTRKIGAAYGSQSNPQVVEALLRKRARVYNNAAYRIPVMASVMNERRGKRALVFVESISAAKESKRVLDEMGQSVAIYHSQMSSHLRRANLRSFRKGIFDVLVACRALDEGFNVPEAEVAIIAAGTSSKRQRIQRVGRVLRSMGGKENGEVITLYATPVEEKRLIEEANSLEIYASTRWIEAKNG
jgi:superfamily II DNA or RNA helicase